MVYQEQIMKIAQDLAGYSLGQADLLRRAMGKKKVSEMQKHRGIFVKGAADHGVDQNIADELFDQMVLFAEYCFNKSIPLPMSCNLPDCSIKSTLSRCLYGSFAHC